MYWKQNLQQLNLKFLVWLIFDIILTNSGRETEVIQTRIFMSSILIYFKMFMKNLVELNIHTNFEWKPTSQLFRRLSKKNRREIRDGDTWGFTRDWCHQGNDRSPSIWLLKSIGSPTIHLEKMEKGPGSWWPVKFIFIVNEIRESISKKREGRCV